MFLLKRYGRLLEEKPLITKGITSIVTFGAGDLLCQYFEMKYSGRTHFDYWRSAKQASFGFAVTPYLHAHFTLIMPYLFPGTSKLSIVKSLLYDQTVGAVIFTTLFFSYLDFSSGKNLYQVKEELKAKMLPTLYANWSVWPFLMLINFSLVPVPWRVLYANICGMFWSAYLSFVQSAKSKQVQTDFINK